MLSNIQSFKHIKRTCSRETWWCYGKCVSLADHYFYAASVHPGVQMSAGKLSGKLDGALGVTLRYTSVPSRGE